MYSFLIKNIYVILITKVLMYNKKDPSCMPTVNVAYNYTLLRR